MILSNGAMRVPTGGWGAGDWNPGLLGAGHLQEAGEEGTGSGMAKGTEARSEKYGSGEG